MIVCADDYGLRDDIDEAILGLCQDGKLSAVSCMVVFARCNGEVLGCLRRHEDLVDVGLHLCLTDEGLALDAGARAPGAASRKPSYGDLLKAALLGRVRPDRIRQEVAAQYELFVRKCGRDPDHIDGHLHAHQLPGVREGLLEFVLSLPPGRRPYIRNTAMPLPGLWKSNLPWVKAGLIGAFGKQMKARLQKAGVATNENFAGVYDFQKWRRYPGFLPGFAACLVERTGILVVHPGKAEAWREQEYRALMEFGFAAGSLSRFKEGPRRIAPGHGPAGIETKAMPLPR